MHLASVLSTFTRDRSVIPATLGGKSSYSSLTDEGATGVPGDCGICPGFQSQKRHHLYKVTFKSYSKISLLLLEMFHFKSVRKQRQPFSCVLNIVLEVFYKRCISHLI